MAMVLFSEPFSLSGIFFLSGRIPDRDTFQGEKAYRTSQFQSLGFIMMGGHGTKEKFPSPWPGAEREPPWNVTLSSSSLSHQSPNCLYKAPRDDNVIILLYKVLFEDSLKKKKKNSNSKIGLVNWA